MYLLYKIVQVVLQYSQIDILEWKDMHTRYLQADQYFYLS